MSGTFPTLRRVEFSRSMSDVLAGLRMPDAMTLWIK